MPNLKTCKIGASDASSRGLPPWSTETQKLWARLDCSRGGTSPVEFPDRGPRELDKQGVLMDSLGGAS